jgi:hypothetical protein
MGLGRNAKDPTLSATRLVRSPDDPRVRSLRSGRWLIPDHDAFAIRPEPPFAQVQYDQHVAKWIGHDGAASDWDIERPVEKAPAGRDEAVDTDFDRLDHQIRLRLRSFGLQDRLRIRIRQTQAAAVAERQTRAWPRRSR